MKDTLNSYVSSTVKSDVNSKSLWVELINNREEFITAYIYRSSQLTREASKLLFQEINTAAKYKNVCIVGDFNCRNVDWINIVGDHESEVSQPAEEDNILDLV